MGRCEVALVVWERALQFWAQNHGFLDRLRLALPWKWGLLPRAMRNRW